MSMMSGQSTGADVGEIVASMREYEAAQKMVSKLIAAEVPAKDIAIVGQGIRTIERVTGRLGYATAARSGAINGLLIGLFLAAIFVLGNSAAPIQAFVGVLFVGVAVGMILSLITFAIVRRRRDYASVMQLAADHYEVTVLPASLQKARQAIGGSVTPRPAPVVSDAPPLYGQRVAPGAQEVAKTPAVPAAPVAPTTATSAPLPPPQYGVRIEQPAAPAPEGDADPVEVTPADATPGDAQAAATEGDAEDTAKS